MLMRDFSRSLATEGKVLELTVDSSGDLSLHDRSTAVALLLLLAMQVGGSSPSPSARVGTGNSHRQIKTLLVTRQYTKSREQFDLVNAGAIAEVDRELCWSFALVGANSGSGRCFEPTTRRHTSWSYLEITSIMSAQFSLPKPVLIGWARKIALSGVQVNKAWTPARVRKNQARSEMVGL